LVEQFGAAGVEVVAEMLDREVGGVACVGEILLAPLRLAIDPRGRFAATATRLATGGLTAHPDLAARCRLAAARLP
jgi:hypothetical protein